MKLRTKLVWVGIGIVLIPMILSTSVMWYLIQQQNDEAEQHHSGHLLDMIREEFARQGSGLVEEMSYFSQDPALIAHLTNLNQREQVNMTPMLQDIHKTEAAIALGKFARINQYDAVMLFDQAQSLLSFVSLQENDLTFGITTSNISESGTPLVKAVTPEDTLWNYGDIEHDSWLVGGFDEMLSIPLSEHFDTPAYTIDIFKDHVAVKTSVPIRAAQQVSSAQSLGILVGYKFFDEAFIQQLKDHTQAEISLFISQHVRLGTLPDVTAMTDETFENLHNFINSENVRYLYTEQKIAEIPYYQAYYPLVVAPDGAIRSTLVLSLSKEPTYQKTREATVLQCWVSVASVLIILPFTLLVARHLTRPIHKISIVSESIASGRIDQQIDPGRSKDEIGVLSRSFHAMVMYLRNMANIAENISHGEITQEFTPASKDDILGKSWARMTRYLKSIALVATRVQQGDLTQIVVPLSEHDVLGTAFNAMIRRLQGLVSHLRIQARELAEASRHIASTSENTSLDNQIQAESIESTMFALHEMASNISSISQSLVNQSESIEQVKSSAYHIVESHDAVSEKIDQLSSFTAQTATAIEKMDDSVQEIHHQVQASVDASNHMSLVVQQGSEQMRLLMTEIMAIQEQMEIASAAILRLQRESKHIGEILEVIQEVVDQTNLLSLNASIIAAQAGTQGKAFAVVAEEIKTLAVRTSGSTKEISQFIRTIQTELTEAVNAMVVSSSYVEGGLKNTEKTEQVFEAVMNGAEQSSQLIERTARNIEEHTLASRQVKQASADVVGMLQEIIQLAQEQHIQSKNIYDETEQFTSISQEIRQATEEQSSAAHQSVEKMGNLSTIVQQNVERAELLEQLAMNLSSQAGELLKLVEQFTVNVTESSS